MRWNYELNKVEYKICSSWLDTSVILSYKEETMDKASKSVFYGNAQCCDIMNDIIKKDMEEIKVDIPKGYEFAGVDDGKQQIVFTKIQPQYPKTYEECCEILKTYCTMPSRPGYKEALIAKFQELLICRDTYWKIAGEQMELGKPWEPDWTNPSKIKYCITNTEGNIATKWTQTITNKILAFPTVEMRDAFKENFDDDIEFCKEFL